MLHVILHVVLHISFMEHFHCSGKNKIGIHVKATKYELSNFGDFAYELNTHRCNQTGIVQDKG